MWEGGHRVPGIVSWPAVVKDTSSRVSWDTVVTMDFLATVMDVLDVQRPVEQREWHFDGVSIMPILRGPHFRMLTATLTPIRTALSRRDPCSTGDWVDVRPA